MIKKFILISFILFAVTNAFAQMSNDDMDAWRNLFKQAQEENKLVLVDFYTDWCKPCKEMDKKVFANIKVQKKLSDKYIYFKCNAEQFEFIHVAQSYEIKEFPTVVVFDAIGQELKRIVGLVSAEEFIAELEQIEKYIQP